METEVDFSQLEYWEERYKSKAAARDCFEWYTTYDTLRPIVERTLEGRKEAEILVAGCGSSAVPIHLYDDGYQNLTCVDFSECIIEYLQTKHKALPSIDWVAMDVRQMNVPTNCFDFVLDKALFDSLCCSDSGATDVEMLLEEIHRVLRRGGFYMIVSYGKPGTRIPHFESCKQPWRLVESSKIPKDAIPGVPHETNRCYYVYIFQKA